LEAVAEMAAVAFARGQQRTGFIRALGFDVPFFGTCDEHRGVEYSPFQISVWLRCGFSFERDDWHGDLLTRSIPESFLLRADTAAGRSVSSASSGSRLLTNELRNAFSRSFFIPRWIIRCGQTRQTIAYLVAAVVLRRSAAG
jgi:hypothetical protein